MRIDIIHDSSYSRYWMIAFFVTGGVSPLRVIIPKAVAFIATTTPLFSTMQSTSSSSSSLSLSMLSSSLLEIEQKFSFTNRSDIEDRLRRENFVSIKEVTMVDWYFDRFNDNVDDDDDDDDYNSLDLPLVRQDHWLRYREILSSQDNENSNDSDSGNDSDRTGKWQLKRGTNTRTTNNNNDSSSCSTTTVYEEVEGLDAVRIANSILKQSLQSQPQNATKSKSNSLLFDEFIIPVLPISDIKNLEPFARIVTRRSTWKQKIMQQNNDRSTTNSSDASSLSLFPNLIVDLDCTPDGYNLGEVEAVVDCKNINAAATAVMSEEEVTEVSKNNDRAVSQAKEDIQQLLSNLSKNDKQQQQQRPPMGKLENFLFCNRPRMYRMCIESGVIPQQQIVLDTNKPEQTDDEMK